jgi:protein involved in polysaccharide export with SLBB domain
VPAGGLTPVELSDSLTRGYSKELSEPRVTVIVRSFGGSVFVTGEVKNPSAPVFWLGMTALQAVASAGGFLDTARTQDVILIRREQNAYRGYRLALDAALSGEDFSQDAHLEPGDILYVSKTPIANVDVWVDQYIRKLLPINTIPIGSF